MKCVDKKNMVPLSKIFYAASQNQHYFKILNEYSFGDKIFNIIKEDKTPNNNQINKLISSTQSQFG